MIRMKDVGGVRGSKHLTGNAIDINMLNTGPGDEWIQKNGASKYGFIYNGYKPDSSLTLTLIQLK